MRLRPVISALVKSLFKDIEQKLDDPDWDPLAEIKKKADTDRETRGESAAQTAGPKLSPEEAAIARIRHAFQTGEWTPQRNNFMTQRYTNKESGISFCVDEIGYIHTDGRLHIYSVEVEGVTVDFLSTAFKRELEGIWKARKDRHAADEAAKRKAKAIAALTGGRA